MWFIGSEATSIDLIADQYQSVMKTIAHICLSIGLLMAWGCTEESLDYRKQEGYVQIALSWDEGFSPAGSRFYFYPENGGEMLSFVSIARRRDSAAFCLSAVIVSLSSIATASMLPCATSGVTIRRKSMYCRTRMASMSASPKGWLTPRVWPSRKLWKFLTATPFGSPLRLVRASNTSGSCWKSGISFR